MKKNIFGLLALSVLVISCDLPSGGNKAVLKREADVPRYDDVVQNQTHTTAHSNAHAMGTQENAGTTPGLQHDDVDIDLKGTVLKGYKNGLEARMIHYLNSGTYAGAGEDALKKVWYEFDHVNFKMNSATELESGEGQLDNLAAILKAYPEAKIKIGGHTDNVGGTKVNKPLSQQRADFIKSELTRRGVGSQVIGTEGYGSQFAEVDENASDAERAVDRKMSVRFAK